MIKKVFFLFFVLISISKAEVVDNIKIFGNERISQETIKVYGDINLNKKKEFSNIDLNNILKELYSTNFFQNIDVKIENQTLIITVKEYPIINQIEIKGEDSIKIKKALIDRLNLKERNSFISNKLNEDVNLIKKIYQSLGFNFAVVETEIESFSNNRVNLIFKIYPGNKSYIKKIDFIGDKKVRVSRLRDIIVSEEKKFWKFLSKNTYLNKSNIELDQRLLLNYYKSIGYYDVQVISNSAEIINNEHINLIYTINAGARYKINKINTNISDVIDKKSFEPLQEIYKEFVGKYYSPFKVKKILDRLDELIANNDLQFIEHSVNEIIEGENIEIRINVYEGKKELVEKINVLGNTITDEAVIRAELLLDEGDPFNRLKIDKSVAKLKARNIFGDIKTDILQGSQNDTKIINLQVEEKATGEITAGAGIGTNGGSFAFSISENNWLGKGINISTQLEASSETFTGGISVVDPNYQFSGNSLIYFAQNTKNDKPNSGFKNNIISTGIGTKFEQYKDIFISPNISYSYDDLKVDSSASTALQNQKGTFSDVTFDYSIITDKRDRVYGPTEGYLFNFSQALPVYADTPFIKNTISMTKYKSFSQNTIGALKLYISGINGLNNEDVRLSKRLNVGSKLRGFERGKIGPKDGADYIGGNYVAVTNLEMNLPNLLPESTKTDVGLFLDFGNVWKVDYNDAIDQSNKIRSTVGVNTSWQSPVGPMSFIFSKNLLKASTDITESFNFRLGTTF